MTVIKKNDIIWVEHDVTGLTYPVRVVHIEKHMMSIIPVRIEDVREF